MLNGVSAGPQSEGPAQCVCAQHMRFVALDDPKMFVQLLQFIPISKHDLHA